MIRLFSFSILLLSSFLIHAQSAFIEAKHGSFMEGQRPYNFVGMNFWHAAMLGMESYPGDRSRLCRELDFLASQGVTNLRVMAASEGDSTYPYRVQPSLQPIIGVYDEAVLKGLDYLLVACKKRKIKLVLMLNNNWEWSGGFGSYLEWNDKRTVSLPKTAAWDWDAYCKRISQFYSCDDCQQAYRNLISKLLNRRNSISGMLYKVDPTIMTWELANEPRPMTKTAEDAFVQWVQNTASFIDSIDHQHLICIGSEGIIGCNQDKALYAKVQSVPEIDYLTLHIWPKNWNWFKDTAIGKDMEQVLHKSIAMIQEHDSIATVLRKPLVLEEFGLPRDLHDFKVGSTTSLRDQYIQRMGSLLTQSVQHKSALQGMGFWAFGGEYKSADQTHLFWQKGMPFIGDPPQEEQGLNAVFMSDISTWKVLSQIGKQVNGSAKK